MALLLISGHPGTGKSTLCRWLEKDRGYVHIEADEEWEEWGNHLLSPDPGTALFLRNRLRQTRGPDVAFEWGFDLTGLGRVQELRMVGLRPWWLSGDEPSARQGYLRQHGAASIVEYETQLGRIEAAWSHIKAVYRGRIIDTVGPGSTYRPLAEIGAAVLGT